MIYLDYQASTPLAPEAREAMLHWLGKDLSDPGKGLFGNPHSAHPIGRRAKAALELAREQVAALFPPGGEVIFTSGATEAINLAMRGSAERGDMRPVAISAIEHPAVRNAADSLGAPVTELAAGQDGIVHFGRAQLPEDVRLVSVMQVNNEIGTIQPVDEWCQAARDQGALFLCDGVQAAGKMPLADADMIALSAHKMYGPIGIGALWLREGVALRPLQRGGAQEAGKRAGTQSPALTAGFGAAAALAAQQMQADREHVSMLWDLARVLFKDWQLNGSAEARWRGNMNIRLAGLDVARLMSDARRVMFSAGSACASGSGLSSRVLRTIGLSDGEAKNSIRLGFGRYTSAEDITEAAEVINNAARAQGCDV